MNYTETKSRIRGMIAVRRDDEDEAIIDLNEIAHDPDFVTTPRNTIAGSLADLAADPKCPLVRIDNKTSGRYRVVKAGESIAKAKKHMPRKEPRKKDEPTEQAQADCTVFEKVGEVDGKILQKCTDGHFYVAQRLTVG
jgi:hypothetical protein